MNKLHFTDERIDEIYKGSSLTSEERNFLIEDTSQMEECDNSKEELCALNDKDLMYYCYGCWADYCRNMF